MGYINTMYKAFGQTFISDDHFLAIVGAFAAVFNSAGEEFMLILVTQQIGNYKERPLYTPQMKLEVQGEKR